MLLIAVSGWLDWREQEMLAYLIEENRGCVGNWVGAATAHR
jgi:hypothetical protein